MKLLKFIAALACAGLCLAPAAQAQQPSSGVRLVYLQDRTFYFTDDHAHVLYQVEVNVPVGAFDVSPDLSQIVFESGTEHWGDLRLLTVASGRVALVQRALTEKSNKGVREAYDHPKFSATGTTVAYEVHRQAPDGRSSAALAMLNIATRKSSPLPQTETGVQGEGDELWWSPDGSRILYNAGGIAGIVTLADGKTRLLRDEAQLKNAGMAYGWAGADCAAAGFGARGAARPQDLVLLNLKTGNARPLLNTLKLPAQDLPSFDAMEISGALILFQETARRAFLYDAVTEEALATIDATQAHLVRSPKPIVQCQ